MRQVPGNPWTVVLNADRTQMGVYKDGRLMFERPANMLTVTGWLLNAMQLPVSVFDHPLAEIPMPRTLPDLPADQPAALRVVHAALDPRWSGVYRGQQLAAEGVTADVPALLALLQTAGVAVPDVVSAVSPWPMGWPMQLPPITRS